MKFWKHFRLVMVILFLPTYLSAQNFEWLQTYGAKYGQESISDVAAEPNGGSTFLMRSDGMPTVDTINIGSSHRYPITKTQNKFLVRLDSVGNVLKLKLIGENIEYLKLFRDEKGNFFISGMVMSTVVFDSVTLYVANGNMLLAKYDNNLNRMWLKQSPIHLNTNFTQGHLMFLLGTADTLVKLGSKTFHFTGVNYIYGELDQTNGNINWCNSLYSNNKGADVLIIGDIQCIKKNFYLMGTCLSNFKIGSDSIYQGQFVIKLDSNGNYLKRFSLKIKRSITSNAESITTDGEHLYLSGIFNDTIIWKEKKIIPQFDPYLGVFEPFVASLTSNLEPRWLYSPKVLDKTKKNMAAFYHAISSEGYIYIGGQLGNKLLFDSTILSPTYTGGDILLFKMDYLGNALWATNGGCDNAQMIGLDAIAGKYVFAAGSYQDSIHFGKFKYKTKGYNDGWVTKISDNSIFRGNIYKGSYCAGDTIKIPYTKGGDFDTSNYFIAELSDENGNFENGGRELGRKKSVNRGTVIGILPSFQVSTSGRYRIRIRSTKPAIQSFYRIDTLRLLIYSKDKANPGPAETICQGDTLKLSTYGGSQWKWNPKYNMNDSTLRQPLVWPTKDTVYRIIIADSYGCGKPDTAFKKIVVRPYPKTILKFNDTVICDNLTLKIPVKFTGGDSAYQWQMFYVTSSKWFFLKSEKPRPNDTLELTTDVDSINNDKFAIVLRDGCTSKPDTTYLTISLSKPVALKTKFMDTLLCYGNKLVRVAKSTGTLPKNAKWQWKDLNTNTILSFSDTLSIIAKQTSKIQLTLTNGCVTDTNIFILSVNPPLMANILINKEPLNDTTLCFGQFLKLFTTGKGGSGMGYNFNWYLDIILLSTSDTLILKSDIFYPKSGGTKSLQLVLKDNCTALADSISKSIKVIESPIADYSVGNSCNLNPIQFTFTGTRPSTPITTSFNWDFAGEATSSIESPSQIISAGKRNITLKVTSSNGCIDIMGKDIDIKPQATANFEAEDACEDTFAIFTNTTKITSGTANYHWSFGDGKTSNLDNPTHKYNIDGVSKTFNVKMAANIPNGCSDSITKPVTINATPKPGYTYTISGQTVSFTATETNANSYHWTFGDGGTTSTNKRTQSYTYSKFPSGKYLACLTTINLSGCSSDSCMEIFISGGISNSTLTGITIYPNPNSGSFAVEIPNRITNAQIQLFDCIGQLVYERKAIEKLNNIDTHLEEGIYIIKITNGKMIYTQRILID